MTVQVAVTLLALAGTVGLVVWGHVGLVRDLRRMDYEAGRGRSRCDR